MKSCNLKSSIKKPELERKVFEKLRKISEKLDLKLSEEAIGVLVLEKKEVIILNYILSPIYTSFGKTPEERIKNIEKFLSSVEFKKSMRKKYLGGAAKNIFRERKMRKLLEKYFPDLSNKVPNSNFIAYAVPIEEVLLHEAIHCLLMFNGIFLPHIQLNEMLVNCILRKFSKT